MTAKKISRALGNIRESYVREAITYNSKRKAWIRWGTIAACLCLFVTAVLTMHAGNGETIIAKYNGEIGDSIIRTPLPGECFFFPEVEHARREYAKKDMKFLLAFDIFNGEEKSLTEAELNAEYQRLASLGYELYYVEDHWTYYGKGEKRYIPIVAGLFTEAQLKEFDCNENYGYSFYFATNGDGSAIEVGEENAISRLDGVAY